MHSLLTEIIFLKPAPPLKQSEEQGINILASARSKSSIKYIWKTINISTKQEVTIPVKMSFGHSYSRVH